MNFKQFINKKISIKKLSLEVEEDLYIQNDNIYVKRDKKLIVNDYIHYEYDNLVQLIKDRLSKNYSEEFDLKDHVPTLFYTDTRNKEVDEYLESQSRLYSEKSLVTLVKDDVETYTYAVGIKPGSQKEISEYFGLPKHGYKLVILKGKFKGTKVILKNGLEAYVISNYKLRDADGVTSFTDSTSKEQKIKHIRRVI